MTLLTVDELRTFITTGLVDAALQTLLDDAEEAITRFDGPVDAAVEIVDGGTPRLVLARPIDSITTVREWDGRSNALNLATDDWETFGDYTLIRLRFGTNSSWSWRGPVRVTYVPVDNTATRKVVQLELVRLEIAFNPGLASETVGAWTQTYAYSNRTLPELRGEVLSRLRDTAAFAVVN